MGSGTGYLVMASHLPLKQITATVRIFRAVSAAAARKQLATADGLMPPLNTWPPGSACFWLLETGDPR
jgi:hypothetical protein